LDVPIPGGVPHRLDDGLQPRLILRLEAADGALHHKSLQYDAEGGDLLDFLRGGRIDKRAPMRCPRYESLILQSPERLTNGDPAHLQLLREIALDEACARPELPLPDRLT